MGTFDADKIEAEYRRLNFRHGWTFMATQESTLRSARVAFVGLNPGGGGPDDRFDYKGIWALPAGNGYFDESWGPNNTKSRIQTQVQKWHGLIDVAPGDSLCAQFVPFRSRSWNELPRKEEALAFASQLWSWVLEVSPASLFVTMGKRPAEHVSGLLGARKVAQLPTGWGKQMIDVWDSPSGKRIVGMPHPSRYSLFGRSSPASETAEASFRAATDLAG